MGQEMVVDGEMILPYGYIQVGFKTRMLSKTGEYAMRAVIHLAQHPDQWPMPGGRIAQEAGIPAKYLAKVLGDLVRAGVLSSSRGKLGGFAMARSPKRTRLIDVLGPFEPPDARRCPFGNRECSDENPCLAHHRWKKVAAGEQDFFRKTSIYDVSFASPTRTKRQRKNVIAKRKSGGVGRLTSKQRVHRQKKNH